MSFLKPGLCGEAELIVGPEHTAKSVGSGKMRAFDEVEEIGSGMHHRVVVNVAKFDVRVARKMRRE